MHPSHHGNPNFFKASKKNLVSFYLHLKGKSSTLLQTTPAGPWFYVALCIITSHLLLWSEWAIFLSSSTTLLDQHHCSLSILALLGWIIHIARQIASPELAVQWVVRDSIHYPLPQGIIGRLHSRIVSLSLYHSAWYGHNIKMFARP